MLVWLLWGGLTLPSLAQECRFEIDRRFTEQVNSINEKINRTQIILKIRLKNINTPDDVIRSIQQDLSRLRQQRDTTAVEWLLLTRRHREPEACTP